MATETWFKFYDANKKHIWSVKSELGANGKHNVAVPSRNARYFSTDIDGGKLHAIPAYDPLAVEYGE